MKTKWTCEELIEENLNDRLEELRAAQENEQLMVQLLEGVLSVEERNDRAEPTTRILLSWGGPADWFDVWNDKGEWVVKYVYEDWNDHAERDLNTDDAKLITNTFGHMFPYIDHDADAKGSFKWIINESKE